MSSSTRDRYRAVLAEDDHVLVKTIKLWLADSNIELEAVTNGADAVDAVDEAVDVLICDRRMPELNGNEVLSRLEEEGHDIPVVVVSAYEPDYHLHTDDVDEYLVKPIDREDLLDALGYVLSADRIRR